MIIFVWFCVVLLSENNKEMTELQKNSLDNLLETAKSNKNVVIEITTTTVLTNALKEHEKYPQSIYSPKLESKKITDKNILSCEKINSNSKPLCYVIFADSNIEKIMEILSESNIYNLKTFKNNASGLSFCSENKELINKIKQEVPYTKIEQDFLYKISSIQYPISRHLFLIKNYTNYIFNSYFYSNFIFRVLQIERLLKYLTGAYRYHYTGKNTKIYILDSTVDIRNPSVENLSGNKRSCISHGNVNVQLINNPIYGFAKDAEITVLDGVNCKGEILLSEILEKLDYVEKSEKPTILLFGVSGPYSELLNNTIDKISSKNIIIISPAGNNHDNACYYSPGSAKSALTIGSVNKHTKISKFSNHGTCVRLYSLGEEIYEFNNVMGTSHSAATITGIASMFFQKFPDGNFYDLWNFLNFNSYWNNNYLIMKLPLLIENSKVKAYELDNSFDIWIHFIMAAIIFVLIIFIIFYMLRSKKKHKNNEELIIDPNERSLRNRKS